MDLLLKNTWWVLFCLVWGESRVPFGGQIGLESPILFTPRMEEQNILPQVAFFPATLQIYEHGMTFFFH